VTKKQKIIGITTVSVVVIVLLGIVLIYGVTLGDPLTNSLKKLFPAKIVGSHMVSVYDYEQAYKLAKKLDPNTTQTAVTEQLVRMEKIKTLAGSLGIVLQSDDVLDELNYLKKGRSDYNQFLNQYFDGDEEMFRRFVAYPQTWDALIRIHYNSQMDENQAAYQEASRILDLIKSGAEKFEDAAKKYSADQITGQLGGDLGFVTHGQIIPELEEQVTVSALGTVADRVMVSRYGYHIAYPVETALQNNEKLWHIKHILIETKGFDEWLESLLRPIKVRNFKK